MIHLDGTALADLLYRSGSPFQRNAALLEDCAPALPAIDMTVGEPRHPAPDLVGPVLAETLADFGRYPPIRGTEALRGAIAGWLDRRYGLGPALDANRMILPLNGSREGLVFAGLTARDFCGKGIARPLILAPNPFYQAYAAAAHAAGAEVLFYEGTNGTGLPDPVTLARELSDADWSRVIALFVASPANPQGACASLDDWTGLIALARRHDFMLFADECYSEIHRGTPPPGALEAAKATGSLDKVVSFNSLSKRSNLPGLRSGFVAGDPAFIEPFARMRNMAAPQVPLPLQAVSARAWEDEAHVVANRALYDAKMAAASHWLGALPDFAVPEAGFFLWLPVGGDDRALVRRLWCAHGLKTIAGSFLAQSDGGNLRNPGSGFIRLALVQNLDTTQAALQRLAEALGLPKPA